MSTITHLINRQVHELREKFGCSQELMGHLIGVSGRTIARWEADQSGLSHLAKQRVDELKNILRKMEGIIQQGKEAEWLNTPNETLRDKTPLEIITQGYEGIQEVSNLLGRLEWGIAT